MHYVMLLSFYSQLHNSLFTGGFLDMDRDASYDSQEAEMQLDQKESGGGQGGILLPYETVVCECLLLLQRGDLNTDKD